MESLFLVLLTCVSVVHISTSLPTFEMGSNCNSELSFITKDLYSTKVNFFGNEDCEYTIESWSIIADRLMIYFDSFSVDCDDGYLEILDGNSEYSSKITGKLCGNKPTTVFTSTGQYLKLKYHRIPGSNRFDYVSSGFFTAVVTAYHRGYCYSYEYECDNGRCINDDLNCNMYNPCGDDSDCRLPGGAIAGIVIGSLCGLALIITVVVVIFCCMRKRPQTANPFPMAPQQGQAMVVMSQTTYPSQQAPQYPGYSVPQQQQVVQPMQMYPQIQQTSNMPPTATSEKL